MACTLWRLARGPSVPDRILALDTLAINAIALAILLGTALSTAAYVEAALLIGADLLVRGAAPGGRMTSSGRRVQLDGCLAVIAWSTSHLTMERAKAR